MSSNRSVGGAKTAYKVRDKEGGGNEFDSAVALPEPKLFVVQLGTNMFGTIVSISFSPSSMPPTSTHLCNVHCEDDDAHGKVG